MRAGHRLRVPDLASQGAGQGKVRLFFEGAETATFEPRPRASLGNFPRHGRHADAEIADDRRGVEASEPGREDTDLLIAPDERAVHGASVRE
jgi:hypothetical protein